MLHKESDYWILIAALKIHSKKWAQKLGLSQCKFEASGYLVGGEIKSPYSGLDILVIAAGGEGSKVRDETPSFAKTLGRLLNIFPDLFPSENIFCSVYSGPLKIDWLVAALGGFVGIGLGALFRHKIAKMSFWVPIILAVLFWLAFFYFLKML